MLPKTFDLKFYAARINKRQPFTFVRYGDGEWSAIFQDRSRTSSGSQALNIPTLKDAMTKSVVKAHRADNYFPAYRRTAMKPRIRKWLRDNASGVNWHDCTVFYKASRHGALHPFIKAVQELGYPVVVIGPERLRKLDGKAFDIAQFIQLPNRDCWQDRRRVMKECMSVKGPAFFTFTAGPAAKPWAWQLYQTKGKDSFILDLGSLWDPYVGKRSRSYHKTLLKNPAIMRRNLTGAQW